MQSLQIRNKWTTPHKNLGVNDIVIIKDQNTPHNQWKLGKVTEVHSDNDGLVRKVKVLVSESNFDNQGKHIKTNRTILERPVYSLALLLENNYV